MIKYIITELDERAKEDKFKIKKILANKRKHKEAEEEIRQLEMKGKSKEITGESIFDDGEDNELNDDQEGMLFN